MTISKLTSPLLLTLALCTTGCDGLQVFDRNGDNEEECEGEGENECGENDDADDDDDNDDDNEGVN